MKRLPFTGREHAKTAIRAAAQTLDGAGILLIPTETYYGLAARPDDERAVARIFAMKGRPSPMALPVLTADWLQLEELVFVPKKYRAKLSRSWPGPLTVILSLHAPLPAAPGGSLAVRIPGHDLLRALLHRVGPLTGTSANRHGAEPSVDPDQALATLLAPPDLVLDGGPTPGGSASTIVDLTGDAPEVIRQGSLAWDDGYPII